MANKSLAIKIMFSTNNNSEEIKQEQNSKTVKYLFVDFFFHVFLADMGRIQGRLRTLL